MGNPYALANWKRRQAEDRLRQASSPLRVFYIVPRALYEQFKDGPFVELASAADAAAPATRIVRAQAWETAKLDVGEGEIAVYEDGGRTFVAKQGW